MDHPEHFAKLWYQISKNYKFYMESALAPALTEGQFIVLDYLMDHEQIKPSDLLTFLETTPAAVTTLLDRMEKNGLIVRERNEKDRRIVWIQLTDTGKAEGERGRQIRTAFFQNGLDPISRHNQQLLLYLLGKVSTNIVDDVNG